MTWVIEQIRSIIEVKDIHIHDAPERYPQLWLDRVPERLENGNAPTLMHLPSGDRWHCETLVPRETGHMLHGQSNFEPFLLSTLIA